MYFFPGRERWAVIGHVAGAGRRRVSEAPEGSRGRFVDAVDVRSTSTLAGDYCCHEDGMLWRRSAPLRRQVGVRLIYGAVLMAPPFRRLLNLGRSSPLISAEVPLC